MAKFISATTLFSRMNGEGQLPLQGEVSCLRFSTGGKFSSRGLGLTIIGGVSCLTIQ